MADEGLAEHYQVLEELGRKFYASNALRLRNRKY